LAAHDPVGLQASLEALRMALRAGRDEAGRWDEIEGRFDAIRKLIETATKQAMVDQRFVPAEKVWETYRLLMLAVVHHVPDLETRKRIQAECRVAMGIQETPRQLPEVIVVNAEVVK